MFECKSNGQYLIIQRIALEQNSSSGQDSEEEGEESDEEEEGGLGEDAYLGPEFETLDDTLQQVCIHCCCEMAGCAAWMRVSRSLHSQ